MRTHFSFEGSFEYASMALLSIYSAVLSNHRALLSIHRTLLSIYRADV